MSKFFAWLLVGMLCIGLAGFSITSFGGGATPVAKVGDTEVTANEYALALQAELRGFSQQMGVNVTLPMAVEAGVDRQVQAQLINRATLDNETAKVGLSVGDEHVARLLAETPGFIGLDGSFDREAYRFTLQQSGLTESQFEESVRADAARSLYEQATLGGITAPESLVDNALAYVAGRRDFTWAIVDEALLDEELPEATEEDLVAYHAANEDAFTLPARKRITYAWVTPTDLIDEVDVAEEELRALYNDRAEQYQVPERRLVERLVFSSEEAAASAKSMIDAGETTFQSLVEGRGLTMGDVDLGDQSKADLGEAGDAIYAMEEPGIIGPLPTDLGPALFRMNAILSAQTTTYEEALPELREELVGDVARRRIEDSLEEIDDKLASGVSLEQLVEETSLTLGTIEWSEDVTDGIAGYGAFREAAAELQEGDFEQAILLEDGGVFAMRFEAEVPPRLQDLSEVRADVREAIRNERLQEALTAKAEELQAAIQAGADPVTLGLTVTIETDQTRTAYIEGTPADFMETVFAMEIGEGRNIPTENGVIFVRLDASNGPDLENPEVVALRSALEASLGQSITQDALAALSDTLRASEGLTINEAVVNAVHANFTQ
ncbi:MULTISPECIES: peptidylprolyl isomerase [Halocynthiibacter]|uniref:SurA N-terminal domain-containing protein n=1 Tax=Halocynthiibacter halioticoli TaxID=2986804 RepID=A0AAE3J0B6_9RHOB|nr:MULTISPECIES: peptidylprolyl isomerase [Halocynthiibacter]MCV6824183.1 SurA N-terminal domain-containing protein [Halocynthiibacter halioticoli]MCW4057184.1 SurA N-terminal domain-containing protein [Halocynthiibacter sp. SDUM655004]